MRDGYGNVKTSTSGLHMLFSETITHTKYFISMPDAKLQQH